MNRQSPLFYFAVFLVIIVGCNISVKDSKPRQENVDGKIEGLIAMASDGRNVFQTAIENELKKNGDRKDSTAKENIAILVHSVMKTDELLDVIIDSLSNLSKQNSDDNNLVFQYLAKGMVGDSLRFYLGKCLDLAQANAVSVDAKKKIVAVSENLLAETGDSENWQQELFGHVKPLSCLLIIYGIQIEMFNIVNKSFLLR